MNGICISRNGRTGKPRSWTLRRRRRPGQGGRAASPVLAWRGGASVPARMASMSSADEARRTLAQLSRERVRARLQLEPEASGLRLCARGDGGGGPGAHAGGELGPTSARRSSAGPSPATWLSMAETSSRASDSLLGAAGVRSTSTTTAPGAPAPPEPPGRTDDSRAVKASSAGSFSLKVLARPAGRGNQEVCGRRAAGRRGSWSPCRPAEEGWEVGAPDSRHPSTPASAAYSASLKKF